MKLFLNLFLSILVITAPGLSAATDSEAPIDFTLKRLHGDELKLSELRGKWVVLNYWATWCSPCRKEIPELSALHSERDDFIVLGMAYEDTELENFDKFLEEFKVSYPILLVDVYSPPEPFGAPRVLPTTIVLNPEGYSVKTYLGPVTREDIESFIDAE